MRGMILHRMSVYYLWRSRPRSYSSAAVERAQERLDTTKRVMISLNSQRRCAWFNAFTGQTAYEVCLLLGLHDTLAGRDRDHERGSLTSRYRATLPTFTGRDTSRSDRPLSIFPSEKAVLATSARIQEEARRPDWRLEDETVRGSSTYDRCQSNCERNDIKALLS